MEQMFLLLKLWGCHKGLPSMLAAASPIIVFFLNCVCVFFIATFFARDKVMHGSNF